MIRPIIIVTDRDAGAVKATNANAKRAGVRNFIAHLQCCTIYTNPWLSNVNYQQSQIEVPKD